MKIKSRDQRLAEYNAEHPYHVDDAVERVKRYFEEHNLDLDRACAKAAAKAAVILEERSYRTIHVLLREYPAGTPRPRTFKGHTFSPNAKENKNYFRKALHSLIDELKLVTTPAEINIEAYLEMPSSVPPDEIILFEAGILSPVDKPDYDNLEKGYTDMFTDIVVIDDDIFYHAEITKFYSLEPRVDVRVSFLERHESEYIYKKLRNRKSVKEAIANGQLNLEILDYGLGSKPKSKRR